MKSTISSSSSMDVLIQQRLRLRQQLRDVIIKKRNNLNKMKFKLTQLEAYNNAASQFENEKSFDIDSCTDDNKLRELLHSLKTENREVIENYNDLIKDRENLNDATKF